MIERLDEAVTRFMVHCGQGVPEKPTVPDEATRNLREALIVEELNELFHATALYEHDSISEEEYLVEVADALGDLLVVVAGAAIAYGIPTMEVLEEIMRSNETKYVDGKIIKDEKGKVLKPESYEPPNLKRVLFPDA